MVNSWLFQALDYKHQRIGIGVGLRRFKDTLEGRQDQ